MLTKTKYPDVTLTTCTYAQITLNKTGDLAMVYKPLLNFIKEGELGDFTTKKLNFDRYNSLDMLIVDEFDGSTNIIINDDNNQPRLINSGFAVLEDNTFLIPEHYTNTVENIYKDTIFDQDTQLFKLYNQIPAVNFIGLKDGGSFKCGSYIFYFRLADSYGNMSNIILHSSIVQIPIGQLDSYKLRMGMQDEITDKSVLFELDNLDSGFDYLRVFYERTSTASDLASTTLFYMIDQNFPINNGKCSILLTGEEQILPISKSDLLNEYADIATCKTHTIVDNTLFLGNVSAFTHEYNILQKLAWCIYPTLETSDFELPDYPTLKSPKEGVKGFYDPQNVYAKVGYWPDEYYRFGIVFVYNNNQLSPVFNILGYDLTKIDGDPTDFILNKNTNNMYEFYDYEPDDYIFNKEILSNSRGVTKLKSESFIRTDVGDIGKQVAKLTYIKFNLDGLKKWLIYTLDLSETEKSIYGTDIISYLQKVHGIKGFFFVRQKRIPTNLAQGLVVGLTTKEHGSIPILQNGYLWETKSFLNENRLVLPIGRTITADSDKVVTKALLVPDAELQEASFNSIFTSSEFTLVTEGNILFDVYNKDVWRTKSYTPSTYNKQLVKLTSVPKDTKLVTNGEDYFSTIAGSPEESYKTEDVQKLWNKTLPQDLTVSLSLIRGKWGYYVGMGYDAETSFNFGDLVTIKKPGFYKNPEALNLLEFQNRFNDYSFYSPISTRYKITDMSDAISCFGGDCFPSVFTHRMMSNFIDPELPTNTKIVDPSCWAKNYAVRCTAEILTKTHSNLTSDSAGFWIPSPLKKSGIVSLIFGILTGNLGIIINAIRESTDDDENKLQLDEFANEIAQAFEVYTGVPSSSSEAWSLELDDPVELGGYLSYKTTGSNGESDNALKKAAEEGKIKVVKPKELEQSSSGLNLKSIFKSDDKWELHGVAQINRADVNAVSFGLWIMFPIRSSMNLALRDVDFNLATEEAKFNKKRSFFPLESMDITNKLPESNVINGATKKTIHKNSYPAYKTVPFMKLEHFNRIYWSKPNVSDTFLNSFRMVYTDQYKEYNKEFGDITKILPLGNSLFVCFDHGMGILPVDRSVKTETEASPYLASRNVLPAQVQALSKDFGSMWKNSVIQTPKGIIYGVDTVAKKIWRTQGSQVEMISDHVVTKFLNDWITLSEFDYKAYQGHVDVKTHYNNFKNDVIFTFVKDIPKEYSTEVDEARLKQYVQQMYSAGLLDSVILGKNKDNKIQIAYGIIENSDVIGSSKDLYGFTDVEEINGGEYKFTFENNTSKTVKGRLNIDKYAELRSGKIYINDLFTGIYLDVLSWDPGVKWSLCYNEQLNKFVTFYDWYPIESCNVDNIYFSFDQDKVDPVYDDLLDDITYVKIDGIVDSIKQNKYFIDDAFSNHVTVHRLYRRTTYIIPSKSGLYLSFYYKPATEFNSGNILDIQGATTKLKRTMKDGWIFTVLSLKDDDDLMLTSINSSLTHLDVCEMKIFNMPNWDEYQTQQESAKVKDNFKYYDIRDYKPNRMYLWKHGQAGIYDNEGKILPTNWYGKQHEFNFEFVALDLTPILKIFNSLKMISNKTKPNKFEYEIVGEGYEWWPYKPIIHWINEKVDDGVFGSLEQAYIDVLSDDVQTIREKYPDFPYTDFEYRSLGNTSYKYKKLPYLKIELTDRKGRQDKSYHPDENDNWGSIRPSMNTLPRKDDYKFNTNETVIKYDEQLNEYRLHDELLGADMWKYGRTRGNMLYLEDYWNVEIRPLNFQWCYLPEGTSELQYKKISETRHRDKYIKIKVRYSGEDLAIIQMIHTMFEQSFA